MKLRILKYKFMFWFSPTDVVWQFIISNVFIGSVLVAQLLELSI